MRQNLDAFFFLLVTCLFFSCKKSTSTPGDYALADLQANYFKFTDKTDFQDSSILKILEPYKDSLGSEMDEVLSINTQNLEKRKPNSSLGNWMTDALKEEGELIFNTAIDFSIQNYGGLRVSTLAAGEVTKGDIYELMPFDNMLVLIEMDSSSVVKICDHMAAYGGWPISEGLEFRIEEEVAKDIKINGEGLKGEALYKAIFPDYIANGGDNCDFLTELEQINSGVFVRTVLIEHLLKKKEGGFKIQANTEERIKI